MVERFREWFMAPARQAAAWAFLAVAGMALGAAGLVFLLTGSDDRPLVAAPATSTPTAIATRVARTKTPTGPTVAVTPRRSATPRPPGTALPSPAGSSVSATPPPTASATPSSTATTARPTVRPTPRPSTPPPPPTPTPTPSPSPTPTPVLLAYCPAPPATPFYVLAGLLEIGGGPAPAGTSVSILFDGAPGPAGEITPGAEESGYKILFAANSEADCANHPGAAIAIVVNGSVVPTGLKVPEEGETAFLRRDVSIP